MSGRSCRQQVQPVHLGSAHDRGKPAVRSREIRRHVVVVVQIITVEVAHSTQSFQVKDWRIGGHGVLREVSSRMYKAVPGPRSHRVIHIPVGVTFIPAGTEILHANRT